MGHFVLGGFLYRGHFVSRGLCLRWFFDRGAYGPVTFARGFLPGAFDLEPTEGYRC